VQVRKARAFGCLGLAVLVVLVAGIGVFLYLRSRGVTPPVPGQQRCVATAGTGSVTVDLDQAHYASIIAGVSVRRGLAPRAASIALATAYQESGIRNLQYGDRDSQGLFQQRPSQGWGTAKQVRDPYHATGRFYSALVKIDGWETRDITEVAQKVQRSGHPDAYRDHEADARVLASVLTGQSPGGLSCLDRRNKAGDAAGLATAMGKTFGSLVDRQSGSVLSVAATSSRLAWAYAHFAVANAAYYGVTTVRVGDQQWQTDTFNLPTWTNASPALDAEALEITVR
jgi:hypothetical protein